MAAYSPSRICLPDAQRWVASRKAIVVAAVRGGLLSMNDACAGYRLTTEEFLSWQTQVDRNGLKGLRATRVQEYRGRIDAHTDTMCGGRPSLSKRQTSRCEIPGLRVPTLQAYRVIRAARPPTAAEPCPALRRWSNAAISCLSLAGSGGT